MYHYVLFSLFLLDKGNEGRMTEVRETCIISAFCSHLLLVVSMYLQRYNMTPYMGKSCRDKQP